MMYQYYDSLSDFLNSIKDFPITEEIINAFVKCWDKIHGNVIGGSLTTLYPTIMVSVSGGSDSDIVIDLVERIGHKGIKVEYVFYDTGLEFQATKDHLQYLEEKYNITIRRERANIPIPAAVKKYGLPFLNKRTSEYLYRLQKHGFTFEDKPFDVLFREYPKCKSALQWWCNENISVCNINNNRHLKEFMVQNPPDFRISNQCCYGAKKSTAKRVQNELCPELNIQGLRKSEGGARATVYKTCFDENHSGCSNLRPVFWFKNSDKKAYEEAFDVKHSDCYSKYGLKRTGCACCPFGKDFEKELQAAKEFEPKLFIASNNVFGKSYEYTRKYKAFCEEQKRGAYNEKP